jgi:hypothetical protein
MFDSIKSPIASKKRKQFHLKHDKIFDSMFNENNTSNCSIDYNYLKHRSDFPSDQFYRENNPLTVEVSFPKLALIFGILIFSKIPTKSR